MGSWDKGLEQDKVVFCLSLASMQAFCNTVIWVINQDRNWDFVKRSYGHTDKQSLKYLGN